jgi:hypothetical protein
MKALTNNTLIAISKHTNKVLKMATYMAQSEQPMLLDNVYMIDDGTPQKDALELFQKDFDKTVDLIEKSHQLLSTVRGDHIVEQLDNNTKDIREIFLDKYDSKFFKVELPSITLDLKHGLDKEEIRNAISTTVLGIDYKTFKDFLKNCDKIYKLDEYSIETEEDAIEYLSTLAYREKYDIIVNKIKTIAGDFSEYRETLGLSNRNLIDNEITFTRSMIDSVMKNSTYITKENVEQLASPHKKNMADVKRLYDFIKNNNYISSIELDPDTNLKSVIDILQKTEDLKMNIPEQFCLKCRKLGNYNANGLYLPRQHIAAVDISNPSALIHELTHAADMSNPELNGHKLREEIINKFKKRIDTNDLSVKNKLSYYLNPEEVIARLGEISYVLNKNDYQGESMSEFIAKVRTNEGEYNSDFLNIAKPVDEYLRRSNIYFNFETMKKEDLMEIKEYFKSYFGVNNDEIKPLYSKAIDYEYKPTKKAKKTENKYKDSPFVKLDPTSIKKALDYNLENNVIPFDDFFFSVAENINMIARRKKGISGDDVRAQLETSKIIYDWVADSNNKDIQVSLLKNMYMFARAPQASAHAAIGIALFYSKDEEGIDKVVSHYNAFNNCRYLNDRGMMEFKNTHRAGLLNVLSKLDFNDVYSRLDKTDLLTYAISVTDVFKDLYNDVKLNKPVRLESHMNQILSDANHNGTIELYNYIQQGNEKYPKQKDFAYSEDQLGMLSQSRNRYMVQLRQVKTDDGLDQNGSSIFGNDDPKNITFSTYYAKGHFMTMIKDLIPAGHQYGEPLDFSGYQAAPLLGTNKPNEENFRANRKLIMDQYLKELQEKQAIEALAKASAPVVEKAPESAVLAQLRKKISEETIATASMEGKTLDIAAEKKDEIKEDVKPIKVDKASQMKLF